ncbi:MAG: hypothetical protein K0Q61_4507 [Rhodococcus erythropolis]|nr:hypothetical protein [Rhodococcus erythropolis]
MWNRPLAHSVAAAAGSVLLAAAVVGVHTVPAAAQQAPRVFDVLCTPTDAGLSELSGLTVTAAGIYAIGDSGSDDRVAELDSNCHVQRWINVGTPRVDVEDLSSTPDGHLWLADIGDNNAVRTSIGLIELDPTSGAATSYPLVYPDGAHDAETLLIQSNGLPVIVTKDYLGASVVYTTAERQQVQDLRTASPTMLAKVGQLRFSPTLTSGGPVPHAGTMAVTGGAVSKDGTVVALRTYTDVYLYTAPDGKGRCLRSEFFEAPVTSRSRAEPQALSGRSRFTSRESGQAPLSWPSEQTTSSNSGDLDSSRAGFVREFSRRNTSTGCVCSERRQSGSVRIHRRSCHGRLPGSSTRTAERTCGVHTFTALRWSP